MKTPGVPSTEEVVRALLHDNTLVCPALRSGDQSPPRQRVPAALIDASTSCRRAAAFVGLMRRHSILPRQFSFAYIAAPRVPDSPIFVAAPRKPRANTITGWVITFPDENASGTVLGTNERTYPCTDRSGTLVASSKSPNETHAPYANDEGLRVLAEAAIRHLHAVVLTSQPYSCELTQHTSPAIGVLA